MADLDWVDFILKLGAIATAVTGVGRLLIGIYKKYVTDPYNKMAEKIQKENSEEMKLAIAPMTTAIERLNYLLEDSQRDRKSLHLKNDEQDGRLDSHETRISVLEDWRTRKQ